MRSFWKRISYIGVTPLLKGAELRGIILVNRITALASFFTFSSILLNILMGTFNFVPALSITLLFFLFAFYLNAIHFYSLAKASVHLTVLSLLTYMQLNKGAGSGLEFYYLSMMVYPMLVWTDNRWVVIFQLICFLSLLGERFYLTIHPPTYDIRALPYRVFFVVNAFYSSSIIILGVLFFKKLNQKSEDELREQSHILEEKNLELQSTNRDLSRSNRDLEQFAYVASHDLKEPLRMIGNYSQLLVDRYGSSNEEAREFGKYVTDGVSRMQQLINDLLTYARMTYAEAEIKKVDLNGVVEDVKKSLRSYIDEKGAVIEYKNLPDVQGVYLQLYRLFQNLISNSVKFSRAEEKPRIKIAARLNGRKWEFSVSDNGIGIEKEYFDKVFVIFQRLHSNRHYDGTGIGLALCKKIVEFHGGKIWVDSEPGKGSTFYFTLPK
jgi:signal transduction histidine kinase